ncbi:MAG: ABC transporter permease, partial [Oscillospiraceae bacterium]
ETGYVADIMPAMQKTCDIYSDDDVSTEIYLVVPSDDTDIDKYILMHERKSGEVLELTDEGIIINEKLGKLLGVSVGDELYINKGHKMKITGIMENYAFNYVYMTEKYYQNAGFDDEIKNNIFYLNLNDGADKEALSSKLVQRDDVLAVSYSSDGGTSFRKLSDSLSMIVVAIIVSAGALAFVVLFNLANINVNERVHELATIKVLGFFDGEVAAYIYRENTISALLGMLVGLVLGVVLEKYVIMEAEVDVVMFAPDIPVYCFLFAAALTLLFALIVNICLYFRLKKIDMAASLKAIE